MGRRNRMYGKNKKNNLDTPEINRFRNITYSKVRRYRKLDFKILNQIPNYIKHLFILALLKNGGKVRPELVKLSGIPQTSIYDYLIILFKFRIVEKTKIKRIWGSGRPYTLWFLTQDWWIGLENYIIEYKVPQIVLDRFNLSITEKGKELVKILPLVV